MELARSHDFYVFLQDEFEKRVKKNPSYSLRAYAQFLDLPPSTLSSLLSRKRRLTKKMIQRLGSRFLLSPKKLQYFLKEENVKYTQFTEDQFQFLSDWRHNAVLELMKTSDFSPSEKWLSQRLELNQNEIKIIVDRLKRSDIIEDKDGKWFDKTGGFSERLSNKYTDDAKKKHQVELREKAIHSIKEDPLETRNHSSMMFAVNPSQLPEAMEKVRTFIREMDQYFNQSKDLTEVYQLAVSLYPITKNKTEKRNKK